MIRRRGESLTLWSGGLSLRPLFPWAIALLVSAALVPVPARAQFGEYTPPGTTSDRPGDNRERLEKEMEDSLWEAGPFRLNPWVGITNAAFVTNAFTTSADQEQETDLTVTLGAGVTGIVPFGQKVFLQFEAIPQYVFWLDQDDRNSFNEWYGARLFGFYNRLYLETGASRRDQVQVRSSEFDQETNTRRDIADLLAEVRLGGSFHVFASAAYADISTLEDEEDPRLSFFSSQDREETVLRGGFRYRPRENVLFGVGVEDSEADFANEARDRSNTGTSPFIEVSYDAAKFFLTGEVVFRDHEPEGETSQFVDLDDATYDLQLTFNPGWRMTYSPYLRRDVFYAIDESYSHFLGDRFGLRIGAILSERWSASLFGETGTDDYEVIPPDLRAPDVLALPREDDVTAWGIDFRVKLSERFALSFGYSLTEFDSNLDTFNRDNGRVSLNLGVSDLVLGRQ